MKQQLYITMFKTAVGFVAAVLIIGFTTHTVHGYTSSLHWFLKTEQIISIGLQIKLFFIKQQIYITMVWSKTAVGFVAAVLIIGFTTHTGHVLTQWWLYPRYHQVFNFNMSENRIPEVYAERLDKTKDWYAAFLEISTDITVKEPDYVCKYKQNIANWFNCNTYPFLLNKDCLVYSFGIANDWRFDDALALLGCEVHSFDPSMGKTAAHKRPSGVQFHPIGLTGVTETSSFKPLVDVYTKSHPNQTWEVKTLGTIMKELGHSERHLDILKMDIETYEWDVVENILNDGIAKKIRQLDVEFHIFKNTPNTDIVNYLEIYQNLKHFGFRRFAGGIYMPMFDKSKTGRQVLAELGYVNLKFDFGRYPLY